MKPVPPASLLLALCVPLLHADDRATNLAIGDPDRKDRQAAVVLVIVRVGSVVPNAPANIGPYQFFTALGHQKEDYANPILYKHILGGILWAMGGK